MSNKFAVLADRCKDENFKKIYQITAEKMNAKSVFEDGTPKDPMSFTDAEVEEIKNKQFATVKTNYAKDGGYKTLEDLRKSVTIDTKEAFKQIQKDGFYNPGSKIGTAEDVGNWNMPYEPLLLGPYDASAMYSSGGLTQIIIDKK